MQAAHHTLTLPDATSVSVSGFLASLLNQGADRDIRCLEADAHDYFLHYCGRMNATISLCQELQWWLTFVTDDRLHNIPDFNALFETEYAKQKSLWEDNNKRRLQLQKPSKRGFVKGLLRESQEQIKETKRFLFPLLSPLQQEAMKRYLDNWLTFLHSRLHTRGRAPKGSIRDFFTHTTSSARQRVILEQIQMAAQDPYKPASQAALKIKLAPQRMLPRGATFVTRLARVATRADNRLTRLFQIPGMHAVFLA